jgi:hypothetical protein
MGRLVPIPLRYWRAASQDLTATVHTIIRTTIGQSYVNQAVPREYRKFKRPFHRSRGPPCPLVALTRCPRSCLPAYLVLPPLANALLWNTVGAPRPGDQPLPRQRASGWRSPVGSRQAADPLAGHG